MSDPQQVRPEVVDAIFAVLKGADPAALPADATREEKDAAKDRYLSEVVAERSKRDRQAQAWELLLTRGYDCHLYTSPSQRDGLQYRMTSTA